MKPYASMVVSEGLGTMLLVLVGCSFVVLDFAPHSPVVQWIPDAGARRALTGFLFGTTGGLIAVSTLGKISGAHINPVVTLVFWLQKKLSGRLALQYVGAQLAGAIVGAFLLSRIFGSWASALHDAATLPGTSGVWVAVLGEIGSTICLVVGLLLFLRSPVLRKYTPAIFAPLYAFLVWAEAPLSGTSTNPARSLGPQLISHTWHAWWIYWVGPATGGLMGIGIMLGLFPWLWQEIEVAKLYHFHHDPHGIFRRERWHRSKPHPDHSIPWH